MPQPLSRRTVLRGAGAALALPLLKAMLPARARAAGEAPKPPVRMMFYIVGGGAYMPDWSIDDSGREQELTPERSVVYQSAAQERDEPLSALSPTLEPLQPHRADLLVLGGLTLVDSYQFEDGHSAEIAGLLTGAPLGRDRVACGTSVDQLAAQHLEGTTYLDSLVLGLDGARPGGAKGIGRVYAQHYSWRSPLTPTGEERHPRAVFDRLFRRRAGRPARGSALSSAQRRSVLDLVRDEANLLKGTVGVDDRRKLDEYLTAVRDVEKRIEFAARRPPDPDAPSLLGDPRLAAINLKIPEGAGIPESYEDYDRLMVDLIALAFATDSTRVAVLTHGGYRSYPEIGVRRGHHDLQHHEGDADKRADLRKVDHFNVGRFADVIDRFQSIRDGEGTLLDNAMVMFGTGMSNGNRHARENLPIVLAGRAGGTIRTGRYIDYNWKRLTPLSNLYVEMLGRLGIPTETFGDSTGGLPGLA
jgi:hypothetical protein